MELQHANEVAWCFGGIIILHMIPMHGSSQSHWEVIDHVTKSCNLIGRTPVQMPLNMFH